MTLTDGSCAWLLLALWRCHWEEATAPACAAHLLCTYLQRRGCLNERNTHWNLIMCSFAFPPLHYPALFTFTATLCIGRTHFRALCVDFLAQKLDNNLVDPALNGSQYEEVFVFFCLYVALRWTGDLPRVSHCLHPLKAGIGSDWPPWPWPQVLKIDGYLRIYIDQWGPCPQLAAISSHYLSRESWVWTVQLYWKQVHI